MKRLVALALVAVFVLCGAMTASAAEFKAKGEFVFAFGYVANGTFYDSAYQDHFAARQRARVQMNFIASENLTGVVHLEIGETQWGNRATGGDLSADRSIIELKHAFISFNVPQTELVFKVGIQGLALPGAMMGTPVLDDDVAAVVASYKINDMVSVVALWARLYDDDLLSANQDRSPKFDEFDAWGLIVPIKGEGWSFVPYFVFAHAGVDAVMENVAALGTNGAWSHVWNRNRTTGAYQLTGQAPDDLFGLLSPAAQAALLINPQQTYSWFARSQQYLWAWWLGAAIEIKMMDPLGFGIDVLYGSVEANADVLDRHGWYVAAKVNYKLDMMTPELFAFWSSGEDGNWKNGSEQLPWITMGWGDMSFSTDNNSQLICGNQTQLVLDGPVGKWGIGFQLKDMSFIKDLTHRLMVMYNQGTNDPKSRRLVNPYLFGAIQPGIFAPALLSNNFAIQNWNNGGVFLTTADHMWEVNFDTSYKIYENLTAIMELGLCDVTYNSSWIRKSNGTAWKAAFGLKYKF